MAVLGPGGMRETDATERARSEVLDIVDGKVVAMLGYNHNTAQDQLHAAAEGLTDGYKPSTSSWSTRPSLQVRRRRPLTSR